MELLQKFRFGALFGVRVCQEDDVEHESDDDGSHQPHTRELHHRYRPLAARYPAVCKREMHTGNDYQRTQWDAVL